MSALKSDPDIVIVGGGLAGLACARHLQQHGISFQIIEASDGLGGRVRTDRVAGFLLDRGFQVLQTAYPEAQRVLDYTRLGLRTFFPGAVIHIDDQSYRVADPLRMPLAAFESLFSPIGTMSDKVRLLALRQRLRRQSIDSIFKSEERTTLDALQREGFSPTIVSTLLRPFLRGIFLEKGLKTSSRMFEFVFKMFADGHGALPANGMGAIPDQLASTLPAESVRLNTRVISVSPNSVTLEYGEHVQARAVVVATEGPEACRLIPGLEPVISCSTTCMYFVADYDPLGSPILALNGDGSGVINSLCVPSSVAPSYAPAGSSLISVSILGIPEEDNKKLETSVRSQLKSWFGPKVDSWRIFRTCRILHALPSQAFPALSQPQRPVKMEQGLYVCGDHRDTASIHGALVSGRRTAETILEDFAF
ncbi:MAG: FAD-dependent oxidoreductase [Ignavibacteriales bacterium]|nr:FAD-dependent oxidoreductase [Ignavibacteriales bacterium]